LTNPEGFRFGLEIEFLLVEASSARALWHKDLTFPQLNEILEQIDFCDLPPLDGLELERPHRKLMPYAVEGYHLPDGEFNPVDLLPKGVEIRTPVCASIEECLGCVEVLYSRLQSALASLGLKSSSLSHHPVEVCFRGPQNKRRYDFWQWAMEVMTTYGPDVNISLPRPLNEKLSADDLHARVNYYGPAVTALSLASPFVQGELWTLRGRVGKSIRTYRRSVVAPAIELHPHERGRLEFKLFDTSNVLEDYHVFFLLWLELALDEGLRGRATSQTRIYDLGAAARFGLEAEGVRPRLNELLDRAPAVLARWGFDSSPLALCYDRMRRGRVPADEMIGLYQQAGLEEVIRRRSALVSAQNHSLSR